MILHADLDAFYASVEQRDDPALRGRPVIVGGAEGGGVVLAASYEAKRCGVRTAMGVRAALRCCPQATVVPPRFSAYVEASRAVFAVFADTTPLVEGLSIDEAFLDVSGLRRVAGEPEQIAATLRAAVRDRVGLPITVGVARTKSLAKVASAVGKPDGLLVVPLGGELAFLHPLPIERLWGVGRVTSEKLRARGITTVGELARVPPDALAAIVGVAAGRHLHALANDHDPRPIVVGRRRRSIGAQRATGSRAYAAAEIEETLIALVDRVARRLRTADRVTRTVVLRLRFEDFSHLTRSHTVPEPTAHTPTILDVARRLLDEAPIDAEHRVTLVGVSLANLDDATAVQLTLPFDRHAGEELDQSVDAVRARFGNAALTRATLLGRDTGIEAPLLDEPAPPAGGAPTLRRRTARSDDPGGPTDAFRPPDRATHPTARGPRRSHPRGAT